MTKLMLSFLASLIFATSSFGQTITYENFKEIIPFLQQEDFKSAYEKTSKLLSTTTNDNSDIRGMVTYMNIFSAAAMVTLDQMTFDEFEKVVTNYKGQYIVMPAHPCVEREGEAFNSLQLSKNEDGKLQGMTISANTNKTSIFCFEYFDYAGNIDPNELIGKTIRCGGVLKSIEVNPNKSKIWVVRLRVSNAFARPITPR